MVINCTNGVFSFCSLVLLSVYDAKGKIGAMPQVSQESMPSVSLDILMAKSGRCPRAWKNLKEALKGSESKNYSGAESEQGSDEEGSHPARNRAPSDDERNEELIPKQGLQGLRFTFQ